MLAARVLERSPADPVVLGLPRGGVPVAAEVAQLLAAPLDILVVRKLGYPGHEEYAMGAVGEGATTVLNPEVVSAGLVSADVVERARLRESAEVERRVARFREGRPAAELRGRTAVIVDDGVATGATAKAGCAIARAWGAARVMLAVPVAAPDSLAGLQDAADEVVCLRAPSRFMAVGMHYIDFRQVDDSEVIELLRASHR